MSTLAPVVDFAVVGGGIVGCAIAECLLRRFGTRRVALLEKERRVAAHQSSHNSGVIHAGVYYTPGSMRAKLCVDGARRMYEFASTHNIAHARLGKLIVAVREDELPRLGVLHERAIANGVRIHRLDSVAAIRAIEPAIERPVAALHSPDSGVIDFSDVAKQLARLVASASERRGSVTLAFQLVDARFDAQDAIWHLRSAAGDLVRARYLVTAAGLQSDRVARLCGAPAEPAIVPVRGEWRIMHAPHSDLVRGLIYPVPDPKFPFLGVHFTRRPRRLGARRAQRDSRRRARGLLAVRRQCRRRHRARQASGRALARASRVCLWRRRVAAQRVAPRPHARACRLFARTACQPPQQRQAERRACNGDVARGQNARRLCARRRTALFARAQCTVASCHCITCNRRPCSHSNSSTDRTPRRVEKKRKSENDIRTRAQRTSPTQHTHE